MVRGGAEANNYDLNFSSNLIRPVPHRSLAHQLLSRLFCSERLSTDGQLVELSCDTRSLSDESL